MKWKLLLVALLALLVLPTTVGAVDFSITDVKIDAQLESDGTVQVKERHTYDFDSEFNGIIREIQPKEGASITGFTAYEKGEELEIEKRNAEYRVHRKGDNEVITFDLQYTITDGMEKYTDGAQFYWPFFDDRNETDYENMTITIMPPEKATDVEFIGYDSAQQTGELKSDGTVVFSLSEVSAGDKGDIRVVYEPTLFPSMTVIDDAIRPAIERDRQEAALLRAKFLENRQTAGTLGAVSLAIGVIGVSLIAFFANLRRKRYRNEVYGHLESTGFYVPESAMSLPTLLLFQNGTASIELMSAALLDLVRKGHVRQLSDQEFELVDANVQIEHEKKLIQLLFFQIGHDRRFTLQELTSYTKEEQHYQLFDDAYNEWQESLKGELDQYEIKVKTTTERVILSLIGVLGIGFAIYFIYYELYWQLAIAIVLTLVAITFAISYSPYNYKGTLMQKEWDRVDKLMEDLDTKKWEGLSLDDRFRALIYGVGVKHPELEAYYKDFSNAQQQLDRNKPSFDDQYRRDSRSDFYGNTYNGGLVYSPLFLVGSFSQASSNVSANAPASSGGVAGGGGVGGGGGGSGAF